VNVLVLHGPNLNLLGEREPEIYGSKTLRSINEDLIQLARELGMSLSIFQSNHEGELIEKIQQADVSGILINAAAYTHTSIGIRDALLTRDLPFVEVHMTNVFSRESYRHHSYLSDVAIGIVSGFGANSYLLGLRAIYGNLTQIE